MKPHKHAEWIKAKADGHTVQERVFCGFWVDMDKESFIFSDSSDYRIKPAEPEKPVREYPVSQMGLDEMAITYNTHESFGRGLAALANAAIRRAIDDGQVVIAPMAALDIDGLGTVYGDVNTLSAFAARLKNDEGRDMAVAKAVRTHICVRGTPTDLVLSEIIAGVK